MAGEEIPRVLPQRDYTEAWNVDKKLRKLGKHIHLGRHPLRYSDIKTFALVLLIWGAFFHLILRPLLSFLAALIGTTFTGPGVLLLLVGPPLVVVIVSRRPGRHGLSVLGSLRAIARDLFDDAVHLRSVPQRTDSDGPSRYVLTYWRADPQQLPQLATQVPFPTTPHVDHAAPRPANGPAVTDQPVPSASSPEPEAELALALQLASDPDLTQITISARRTP